MKCPECGQWNRASMPHCSRCGAPLNIDEASHIAWKDTLRDGGVSSSYMRADEFGQTDATPDSRDILAREMQELKERKQKGVELQKKMRRNADRQRDDGISVTEAQDSESAPCKLLIESHSRSFQEARRESEARHRVRFMDDTGAFVESRTYDPLLPDYPGDPRNGKPDAHSSRHHVRFVNDRRLLTRHNIILAFVLVLVLFLTGFTAHQLSSNKDGPIIVRLFDNTFLEAPVRGLAEAIVPDSVTSKSNNDARVFATMKDDLAAHTILIPGKDGDTIYIRELHISYVVVDGFATIEIPDHTWYDNHTGALDETMEVTLTPFLKTSASAQKPLDPVTYTIDIPLSPITLDTPDSLRKTVSTTMSAIKVIVRPGSTVTINGKDYSDTVSSETGELSYNATVQPIGDNVFDIVVRSPYCRDNSIQVVLYRAPQEIPLDLAVGTYGSTNSKIMKVTATTMPGAYVEVTTPHTDLDITELDTTGKFSFNAVFDKIGDNTITIVSSYPGKRSSQVDHVVYYLPSPEIYTVKAWPLGEAEYAELLGNLQYRAEHSQIYEIKGVVQYTVTDKPQRVVIYSSADGKSQPVVVENYTKKKWEVGKYYRLFGDVYSTYDNMPWFNVRYTYDK